MSPTLNTEPRNRSLKVTTTEESPRVETTARMPSSKTFSIVATSPVRSAVLTATTLKESLRTTSAPRKRSSTFTWGEVSTRILRPLTNTSSELSGFTSSSTPYPEGGADNWATSLRKDSTCSRTSRRRFASCCRWFSACDNCPLAVSNFSSHSRRSRGARDNLPRRSSISARRASRSCVSTCSPYREFMAHPYP